MHQNGQWYVAELQQGHFPNSAAFIYPQNFYLFAQTYCSFHKATYQPLKVSLSWVPGTPISGKGFHTKWQSCITAYSNLMCQRIPVTIFSSLQKSSLLSSTVWDRALVLLTSCVALSIPQSWSIAEIPVHDTKQVKGIWGLHSG